MSLWSDLLAHGLTRPDEVVITTPNRAWNWSDFLKLVGHYTGFLTSYNGKVIALWADNSVHWVALDLAAKASGVILIPIPVFFSLHQVSHALSESAACAVIIDNSPASAIDIAVDEAQALCDVLSLYPLCDFHVETRIPTGTNKITFTSGSTGTPKGVCLSEDNQIRVAEALVERIAIKSPRHLCVMPFSTLLENVAGIYAPLLSEGELIIIDSSSLGFNGANQVDFEQLCKQITHYQPETMILIPAILMGLVIAAKQGWKVPSSLKFIAVGGAHVSPSLLAECESLNLPVYQGYGLSENASVVSINSPNDKDLQSVGRVLKHLNIEEKDGEIHVGGNAFLGYLNQPESWGQPVVATGDIGEVNDAGYVTLHGRKSNLLISSYGRNISPEWVEGEILTHPAIAQCIVLGDAKPYCVALLTLRDNNFERALIEQWITQVNQRLPSYAQIRQYRVMTAPFSVEDNTLTTNGRLKREQINMKYQSEINDLYRERA